MNFLDTFVLREIRNNKYVHHYNVRYLAKFLHNKRDIKILLFYIRITFMTCIVCLSVTTGTPTAFSNLNIFATEGPKKEDYFISSFHSQRKVSGFC